MTGKPVVSVVIPAYFRTEMLEKAVKSFFDQTLEYDRFEVIVVDSSPDDRNERMIGELATRAPFSLRCVRKKAEGPGPSRNLGVALTSGEFIAFMDSDCSASPGWLDAGIRTFKPGVGIVQGRTMPEPNGKLGIFRWYLQVEKENFLYETANVFYRREAFESADGFPADLMPTAKKHMGGEDVALAWNVKRNGWKSAFAADALVFHEVVPLSVWNWVVIKQHFIWPSLIRSFPELRQFMFCSYFLDKAQASIFLALVGSVVVVFVHPLGLLLLAPYVLIRGSEPSQSLRGPFRLLRVMAYAGRDVASFVILAAGSIRFRRLLL